MIKVQASSSRSWLPSADSTAAFLLDKEPVEVSFRGTELPVTERALTTPLRLTRHRVGTVPGGTNYLTAQAALHVPGCAATVLDALLQGKRKMTVPAEELASLRQFLHTDGASPSGWRSTPGSYVLVAVLAPPSSRAAFLGTDSELSAAVLTSLDGPAVVAASLRRASRLVRLAASLARLRAKGRAIPTPAPGNAVLTQPQIYVGRRAADPGSNLLARAALFAVLVI